jgi:hypothetical protein
MTRSGPAEHDFFRQQAALEEWLDLAKTAEK